MKKILSCQVCVKPVGNSCVSHYVNEHPSSEVLVSRLAPEVAEKIRTQGALECKIVRSKTSANYLYQQFCYFCNIEKVFTKDAWFVHMARHTGYYRVKCNDCSRLFAEKPVKLTCNAINDFVKIQHAQFQKKTKFIQAFVCDICNFVRFDRKEIENHLCNEHEDDDVTKFKAVTFLTFPKKERKSKFKPQLELEVDENLEDEEESDFESGSESEWKSDGDENDVMSETSDSDSNCE